MDYVNGNWKTLIDLVHSDNDNILEVQEAVSKLTKAEIEETYENGMNLMHHAVLKNRTDIINELYKQDMFDASHYPESFPYLHMAVALGHLPVVEIMVCTRYFDRKVSSYNTHWKNFIEEHVSILDDEMKAKFLSGVSLTVFDVAVLVKQKDCLLELIDEDDAEYDMDEPRNILIKSLIKTNCLSAMPMILTELDVKAQDKGFQNSVAAVAPEFLRAILQFNPTNKFLFELKNPYHLLYLVDIAGDVEKSALQCTKLLIQHGWDVNAMNRLATYPLYSAIYCLFCCVRTLPREIMVRKLLEGCECISELLAAGADPNFNEIVNEPSEPIRKTDAEVSVELEQDEERPAFSSAVEAVCYLLDSLPYEQYSQPHIISFFKRVSLLLTQYGCEMRGQRKWLGRMVEKSGPAGLELLLSLVNFNYYSLNHAFEMSLRRLSASCLRLLLHYAKERNVIFKHPNPFHFICQYSPHVSWPGEAAKCIDILIQEGYDVTKTNVQGSYPLHRLMHNTSLRRTEEDLDETFKCFSNLLAAGAKPNFSEGSKTAPIQTISAFEARNLTPVEKPFSCSAAALFKYVTTAQHGVCPLRLALPFVRKCARLFSDNGSQLHDYVENGETLLMVAFRIFSTREVHWCSDKRTEMLQDISKTVKCLLSLGADIQAVDDIGRLPWCNFLTNFDSYVYQIFVDYDDLPPWKQLGSLHVLLPNLRPIFHFLDLMEMKKMYIAADQLNNCIKQCSELVDGEIDGLTTEVSSHFKVRSLYKCCLIKVWRLCGLKQAEVRKLHLPSPILDDFESVLFL